MSNGDRTPQQLADQLDQLLSRRNPPAAEDALLHTAHLLHDAPHPQMPPDMFERVRARTLAAHDQARFAHPRASAPSHLLRWAASIVFVVIISSMLAVPASADSTPGDPLYPVKRAAEQVELLLAADEMARATVHLTHAQRRIEEARVLMARGEDITRIIAEASLSFGKGADVAKNHPELSTAIATVSEALYIFSPVEEVALATAQPPPLISGAVATTTPSPTLTVTVTLTPTLTPTNQPSPTPPPPTATAWRLYIFATAPVNVRSGPGTQFEIVVQIAPETPVDVLSRSTDGEWMEVALADSQSGWVAAFLLATAPATPINSVSAPPEREQPLDPAIISDTPGATIGRGEIGDDPGERPTNPVEQGDLPSPVDQPPGPPEVDPCMLPGNACNAPGHTGDTPGQGGGLPPGQNPDGSPGGGRRGG